MRRTRVVLADPGWKFGDNLPGGGRGALKHYRCDGIADICNWLPDLIMLGVVPPLADDAVLFMWRVGAMQREALAVVRAWGFDDPTSDVPWIKTTDDGKLVRITMGRTVRNAHEICVLARRGKPKRRDASVDSVIFAPLGEVHSAKPEALQDKIERLYAGPYVELNARRQRPGWLCIGDQMPQQESKTP